MNYVLKAAEMKTCDQNTVRQIGIPSLVLMERAALSAVQAMEEQGVRPSRVLVVAGTGNNGGDGLAVGRLLSQKGAEVTFYMEGSPQRMTQETRKQREILENMGLSILSKLENAEYDMIVDALFGIGLSREVSGSFAETVERINSMKEEGAQVWSLDIPSGICADTGKVSGCAVQADATVTFAFAKRGHLLYPGRIYTGKLMVKDIGIPGKAFGGQYPTAFCYEEADLVVSMPRREPGGNKSTFGKVLLIAGSRDMSGACVLSGGAILHTGAGMLKIITPACNREIVQQSLPEAMLYTFEEMPQEEKIRSSLEWADVVVIGPGMGTEKTSYLLLDTVLKYAVKEGKDMPLVIDADGLNMIADDSKLRKLIKERGAEGAVILTPHPGELTRLTHKDMKAYEEDRERMIRELAEELSCTVAAKDAATMVIGAQKREIYINTSGNDGMATAGSGDVLAGIIGALLAQGMDGFAGASLGVFLHGLAGDAAAGEKGRYGMVAGDIIKGLNSVTRMID